MSRGRRSYRLWVGPLFIAAAGFFIRPAGEALAADARQARRSEYASWGRNPFLTKEIFLQKKTLGLSGVIWDSTNPRAIIDNTIVGVGDSVSGARVVEIRKSSVVLNDGERDFELELGQG